MPIGNAILDGPRSATVFLLNGEGIVGRIAKFDPVASILNLRIPFRMSDGGVFERTHSLPMEMVSSVALHKGQGPAAPPARGGAGVRELRVRIPGNRDFLVEVVASKLENPTGFVGVPVAQNSPYSMLYFFAARIHSREDSEPIGGLLVANEEIDQETLEEGLTEQEINRNVRIGDILVENQTIESEAVDAAAVKQRELLRQGKKIRLGEVLVQEGLVTQGEIDSALVEQKKRKGKRLGELLVERGAVDEQTLAKTLAQKFGLPFVDLDTVGTDPDAWIEIPPGLMARFRLLPFATDHTTIKVAMSDPLALEALDMLRFSSSKRIEEYIATPTQLETHLNPVLAGVDGELASHKAEEDSVEVIEDDDHVEVPPEVRVIKGTAVTRLVDRMILTAFRHGASDIHIEPNGSNKQTVVRFRIDGQCLVYRKVSADYRRELVSRLKVMGRLDIAERRRPQDGRVRLRVGDKRLDLRMATIPTVGGDEDIVLRILPGEGTMPLGRLHLSERNLTELKRLVQRPYGLILCAGPTGSGKTTSVHAMVEGINTETRKIWTAEDPVEIVHPGIRQVQVNPSIGFTFAKAMRAFLRADPDVILVGEMRDLETASTGVEAALTGHLVLSTLHTNNAPETITRLLDMGIDPFTFSDSLLCVLAQRLVRKLCPTCRKSYDGKKDLQTIHERLKNNPDVNRLQGKFVPLFMANGCEECFNTGYRGRVAIQELLVVSDEVRELIQQKAPVSEIRQKAEEAGMKSLLSDGLDKAMLGLTDLRQVVAAANL